MPTAFGTVDHNLNLNLCLLETQRGNCNFLYNSNTVGNNVDIYIYFFTSEKDVLFLSVKVLTPVDMAESSSTSY